MGKCKNGQIVAFAYTDLMWELEKNEKDIHHFTFNIRHGHSGTCHLPCAPYDCAPTA